LILKEKQRSAGFNIRFIDLDSYGLHNQVHRQHEPEFVFSSGETSLDTSEGSANHPNSPALCQERVRLYREPRIQT
jgi:hypothetical protein